MRSFRSGLLLLMLLPIGASAAAQTVDLSASRQLLADLSPVQWRFHTGDDPGWANPAFDDRSWPLLYANKSWSQQGYAGYHGFAWYRVHIHLPAPGLTLALAPVHIDNAYQLFVNGTLVGGAGVLSSRAHLVHRPYGYYTASVQGADMVIAVRVFVFDFAAQGGVGGFHANDTVPAGSGALPGFLIGSPELVKPLNNYRNLLITEQSTVEIFSSILAVCSSFVAIVLWLRQRGSREYLLLGLSVLFASVSQPLIYGLFPGALIDTSWMGVGLSICLLGTFSCAFLFIFAIVHEPMGRISRTLFWFGVSLCLLTAAATISGSFGGRWLSSLFEVVAPSVAILVFYGTTLPILLRRWHMVEARQVFIAWIARGSVGVGNVLLAWSYILGLQHRFIQLPNVLNRPFPLTADKLSLFLFLPIMGWILLDRFASVSARLTRQRSEVEAAQRIQSILLKTAESTGAGWKIDSVYRAAAELGGDFYHVATFPGGARRIVIGDVSGKGLAAAMVVSAVIGALDLLRHEPLAPSAVLAKLNELLLERQAGGFTTCLALHADLSGVVTVANAGHLAPYLKGKELDLENGLPLGLSADSIYPETAFNLPADTQLTLVTDGVIEARNPSGQLFGFDRAAAISTGSAQSIARAASTFGQEDDITVFTLTRLATTSEQPPKQLQEPAPAPA